MDEQFFNVVIPPLFSSYTYLAPENAELLPATGWRITVPLGKRETSGYVVAVQPTAPNPEIKLKPLKIGKSDQLCFTSEQLAFFEKSAEYYSAHLSQVIDLAVPHPTPPPLIELVELIKPDRPRGKKQQHIIEILANNNGKAELAEIKARIGSVSAPLRALKESGSIRISRLPQTRTQATPTHAEWAKTEVVLNRDQLAAYQQIVECSAQNKFSTFLLHGVTGSGKTEVYIETAKEVLRSSKSVLVIVPEIALTPQLIDRFQARLGSDISILHSALGKNDRWHSWWKLLNTSHGIAIGARSAVFAPMPNLGLIIVDEEHDGSFKQNEGIRYNARDLAVLRGKLNNCPVVLGSATPSLETYANAETEKYIKIDLPSKHSAHQQSEITVVDLNRLRPWEMISPHVSPQLKSALDQTIVDGNQAFILYNRRGFASFLQCDKCATVVRCQNCSVTLTYHRSSNSLLCHYCGLSCAPTKYCSTCASKASMETPEAGGGGVLVERGAGTERIMEELVELYPEIRIERLDRDVVSDLDSYKAILERVRRGETQVLVGTQMIAKGHDLPGVTLVGIADCDVGLHIPDFRAAERTFQLLTQAIGRAGRGEHKGRVVLQTRAPRHPSIIGSVRGEFREFAQYELASRQAHNYPPYSRLLRVIVSSQDSELAQREALRISQLLRASIKQEKLPVALLGPSPAPLQRIKTLWRWHFVLKARSPKLLNQLVQLAKSTQKKSEQIRVVFDMDALEML